MRTKVNTELFTHNMSELAKKFSSGNIFLDDFLRSSDAFDNGIGKTFVWINEKCTEIIGYYNIGVGYIDMYNGEDKYKIGGSIHLNFFAINQKYRGVAATDEGYSLYKRNYFEDLDEELHFSFKDEEKGCRQMYLALDIE